MATRRRRPQDAYDAHDVHGSRDQHNAYDAFDAHDAHDPRTSHDAHAPRTRRARRDPRPYIGDSGRSFEGVADIATVSIGMVVLALVVGFVIGFLVYLVMNLSIWLTSILWDGLGGRVNVAFFPLVTCTLGGLAIGLWTHYSRSRVRGLEEVMAEFKATGSYDAGNPAKAVVSFLLPLVFGGSVGFEAGLTGLITAGCCWVRDKLKLAGMREVHITDVTIAASLSAIFGAPLAGIVAGAESSPADGSDVLEEPDIDDYTMRRGVKIVLYTAAAIGAFAGVGAFSSLFGGASGLPRFDHISAGPSELVWVIPCLVVAYLLTLVYHGSRTGFSLLAWRLGDDMRATIAKPVIAGAILGLAAMVFPYVLFPGETQSHELMSTWTSWTALALIATGVLKAVVTPLCINMGWMGGHFFPSIFAGVACGFGLAMLTGADPMLMVTVVTTAFLAGVTRKPVLTLAILALCFPLDGILWSGLAAVVGATLPLPRIFVRGPAADEV